MEINKVWRAAVYVRISKGNMDDTVDSQCRIVINHLNSLDDVKICAIKIDDGYSGINCNRPGFQEMLDGIRGGSIDCVAARDLSRLSRNSIDAERLIQITFPSLGVRFISVFEGTDLLTSPDYNASMLLSFRNLINEDYLRQLSINIKSSIKQGYLNGKHMGALAVYGYRKSRNNRHKLEPDPVPVKIIQEIFQWKLEGLNLTAIAEKLNQRGVLSPADFKRTQTSAQCTDSHNEKHTDWTPVAVNRILSNKVYTGCLEQGKTEKPNFKVAFKKQKPQDDWICVENTHEAIIPSVLYEAVYRLRLMDTRNTPGEKKLPALAGFIRCKSCGENLIRQNVYSCDKKYIYYTCKKGTCSCHRIPKHKLEEEVLL